LGALLVALVVAAVLWRVQPIATGRAYELAFEVTCVLLVMWFAWADPGRWTNNPRALALVAIVGSVWSAAHLFDLNPNSEVVRVYRSVFSALDRSVNPYTCDCIVHVTDRGPRLGNFNYPPAEIWPYRLADSVAGHWNIAVLVTTLFVLSLGAFLLLWYAMVPGTRWRLLAFSPFLVLWEFRTNVATTLFVVAAIAALVLAGARRPRRWHRQALWVLFGIGILTKFVVLPLFAVWWWSGASAGLREAIGRGRRALLRAGRRAAFDLFAPIAIAVALCLPFGVVSIVRATVLFNLELDERAALTDFYPNVVSGLLTWVGLDHLFPIAAVTLMGAAVLIAPRLRLLTAMLVATTTFMLVSPTPEPQYLPVVVLVFLAALAHREQDHSARSCEPRAPTLRRAPTAPGVDGPLHAPTQLAARQVCRDGGQPPR
jgi:hypothetical protein